MQFAGLAEPADAAKHGHTLDLFRVVQALEQMLHAPFPLGQVNPYEGDIQSIHICLAASTPSPAAVTQTITLMTTFNIALPGWPEPQTWEATTPL